MLFIMQGMYTQNLLKEQAQVDVIDGSNPA